MNNLILMADRFIEQCLIRNIGSKIGNDNLGSILLLVAIICLGLEYTVVRIVVSDTDLGSLTFFACRFIISSALLGIIQLVTKALQPNDDTGPKPVQYWIDIAWWGSLAGITLGGCILAVQYGLVTQTVAQASFVMAMYVVVIPLAELALSNFADILPWRTWLAVVLDIPGIILLSGCAESNCFTNFQWGLLLLVVSMLSIVANIMITARAVSVIGAIPLINASYIFCGVIGLILALSLETEQWTYPYSQIRSTWYLILSTSLLEVICTISYTVALAFTSTSRVAIVTSIESLSGAFFGYIILGETLVGLEYLGASLMLIAVMVELIPCDTAKKGKDESEDGVGITNTESTPLLEVDRRAAI